MSAKFGSASKPATVVFNAVARLSNAAFVGAKTVKLANGFVTAGSNSAVTIAVTNEVKPLSIPRSATVSTGNNIPLIT